MPCLTISRKASTGNDTASEYQASRVSRCQHPHPRDHLSPLSLRGATARRQEDFVPIFSPLVLDSARYYVRERFPQHLAAFEMLLGLLEYELAPDPSPDQVAAHPNLVRDAKDIPVALAAIEAGADYLVTTDQDFTDEDETTAELRRHLNCKKVGSFLREVIGWTSQELSAIERRRWSDLQRPFWEEA